MKNLEDSPKKPPVSDVLTMCGDVVSRIQRQLEEEAELRWSPLTTKARAFYSADGRIMRRPSLHYDEPD